MLEPVGRLYILLVQIVVYPYFISSLLLGIGTLKPQSAHRLFRAGLPVYVLLWLAMSAFMILSVSALPAARQIIYAEATSDVAFFDSILALIIPSNPFAALSENHMAGIVLFCIVFGIALQHVEKKDAFLSFLETVREGSKQFWSWTSKLVPYAVFTLFAISAGTTSVGQLPELGLYLSLIALSCLMLALWVVPSILASVSPLTYRQTVAEFRPAIAVAVATSVTAVAIPVIVDMTRRHLEKAGVQDEHRDDIVATNVSLGFVLTASSAIVIYVFTNFAGSYYGVVFSLIEQLTLPVIVFLSSAGSATSALTFLGGWLNLPADAIELYSETSIITKYFVIIAQVVALGFASLAVMLRYYGLLKFNALRLALTTAIPLAIFAVFMFLVGTYAASLIGSHLPSYHTFELSRDDTANVTMSIDNSPNGPDEKTDDSSAFDLIQKRGALRVGFAEDTPPFAYKNDNGDLVGFDIAFAYELARALSVNLVLVPTKHEAWYDELSNGRFDLAVGGLDMSEARLLKLFPSDSYLRSAPALLGKSETISRLKTREALVREKGLTLVALSEGGTLDWLRQQFPNVTFDPVTQFDDPPKLEDKQVAYIPEVSARAVAQSHDLGLAASIPTDIGNDFIFVYFMPEGSVRLQYFTNALLGYLKESDWYDRHSAQWFDGRAPRETEIRWSVMRNVLGWGTEPDDTGN